MGGGGDTPGVCESPCGGGDTPGVCESPCGGWGVIHLESVSHLVGWG